MPSVYKVWRVDCECGTAIDYGEDEATVPEACEECGAEIEEVVEG
jgi:hypothetical protein